MWLWKRVISIQLLCGFKLKVYTLPWAVVDFNTTFVWVQGRVCTCHSYMTSISIQLLCGFKWQKSQVMWLCFDFNTTFVWVQVLWMALVLFDCYYFNTTFVWVQERVSRRYALEWAISIQLLCGFKLLL